MSRGKKHKLHIVEEVEDEMVHVFCNELIYEDGVVENLPLSLDVKHRICKRCLARAERIRKGTYG